jgi:hypothetical protein
MPTGRSGGSGAMNGGRGCACMSSALAGCGVICTAANTPIQAERSRVRCLPRICPKGSLIFASVRILLTKFVHSWQPVQSLSSGSGHVNPHWIALHVH